MEVGVRLDEIGDAVRSQIGVHVIDIYTVAEGIVGKYITGTFVLSAAFIPSQDAADGSTKSDIYDVIGKPAPVGIASAIARQKS